MRSRWVWAGVIGVVILAALGSQGGAPEPSPSPIPAAATPTAAPSITSAPTAAPTSPPTAGPTEPPSVAFMLARVNARNADRPDEQTSEADAVRSFQEFLDCATAAYPSETETSIGDSLVASWQKSSQRDTLLAFARALC